MTDNLDRLADAANAHRQESMPEELTHIPGACPSCHVSTDIEVEPNAPPDRGLVVACDHCGKQASLGAFIKRLQHEAHAFDKARRKANDAANKQARKQADLDREKAEWDHRETEALALKKTFDERAAIKRNHDDQVAEDRRVRLEARKLQALGCQKCGSRDIGNRSTDSTAGKMLFWIGLLSCLTLYGIPLGIILMVGGGSMQRHWCECSDCGYRWT